MSIAQSEASEALPVIDVSGLHDSAIDRRAVARELRLASTNTGFFYITGHGIPTELVDRVFQQSREFFALPMEQKLALSMTRSACRHGYEPLKAQTLEAGAPPDLKEGFWQARISRPIIRQSATTRPTSGPINGLRSFTNSRMS